MHNSKAYRMFFYTPLRKAVDCFLRLRYGYRHDRDTLPAGGTLIVANHTAGIDPLFCAVCFPQPLSFVLSEHLKRKALLTKMMDACFDTITRVKTRTESQTAFTMIKQLKKGANILIFPEGNMTYSGVSGDNMPGLGRLVKISGCNLVTMRLENTFALSPRWAKYAARGQAYGRIVRVYTARELEQMSAQQIETVMTQETYFDFYAHKSEGYRGRARAQCLQSALFLCPRCGGISTLHSKGDRFWCDCGLQLRLNPLLRFVSLTTDPAPFETIAQWYQWQKDRLQQLCAQAQADTPLTQDANITVNSYTVSPPSTKHLTRGTVALYADRLQISGDVTFSISIADITDVTTVQRRLLCICVNHEKYYEFVGTDDFSPVKYAYLTATLSHARSMI
jgi:hypothetical protein